MLTYTATYSPEDSPKTGRLPLIRKGLTMAWKYHDDDENLIDGVGFADPGGRSALRAATRENPRTLPCPNCGEPNRLTPLDRARGYRCNACADQAECGC